MKLGASKPALATLEQPQVDDCIDRADHPNATQCHRTGRSKQGDTRAMQQGLVHTDSRLTKSANIEETLKTSRIQLQGIRAAPPSLAPISHLPIDILAMILIVGYEDSRFKEENRQAEDDGFGWFSDGYYETEDPETQHFPTLFSHVCLRWRGVALSTATVWSRLVFSPGQSCERIAEWIRRSKQSRLVVELTTANEENTYDFQRTLKIIGSNVLRATSLDLCPGTVDHLFEGLKHFCAHGRPPPLKRLRLTASRIYGLVTCQDFDEAQWKVLGDMAEGVEHLHLRNLFFSPGSPAYRRLKTLRLDSLAYGLGEGDQPMGRALLAIIQGSPELESLTLADEGSYCGRSEVSTQPTTVLFWKLKIFVIHKMSLGLTCSILSAISAPALEDFTLLDYMADVTSSELQDTSLPNILLAFFQRSQPTSLKNLGFATQSEHVNLHLERILVHTPRLESLFVDDEGAMNDDVLRGMLDPDRLVPNLQRFWLRGDEVSAPLLKELVLERNEVNSTSPIQTLALDRCKPEDMDAKILRTLEDKVEELVWDPDDWDL